MNWRQRSRTPLKRINYPIINFEQLKKEQQYLDSAFLIYDTYNNEVFNSLRQIEKTIDLAIKRPSHYKSKSHKLNFSEIIERPKQKPALRDQKEYLNSTFILTNIYKEPELLWNQHKTRYGKREYSIKPARHPLKIQESLDLNPQKFKRLTSAKLRNWV